MKFIYIVKERVTMLEPGKPAEEILDSVGIACATEELAKHEIEKVANHLIDVRDNFFGKCVDSSGLFCDGAGVWNLQFTYECGKTLNHEWKIIGTDLIES